LRRTATVLGPDWLVRAHRADRRRCVDRRSARDPARAWTVATSVTRRSRRRPDGVGGVESGGAGRDDAPAPPAPAVARAARARALRRPMRRAARCRLVVSREALLRVSALF